MGAGLGFGLDAFGALGGFFQQRKETAAYNEAVKRRNRLAINAYDTKNRNESNIWRNNKIDLDINTDQKYREAVSSIAENQLKAREVAGDAAIAQQKILAQMFNARGAREQTGRRAGRGDIAMLGAQYSAVGAKAAFASDAAILNESKLRRAVTEVAQGNYVQYITGRPSPAAPPIMEQYKSGPSVFNLAMNIGSAGLKRYMQWQDKKAPDAYTKSYDMETPIGGIEMPQMPEKNPYTPDSSLNLQPITSSEFLGGNVELGNELLSFVQDKKGSNALNLKIQDSFQIGG